MTDDQEFLDRIEAAGRAQEAADQAAPLEEGFDSHPPEMYALFVKQPTGRWLLNRFCYDRGSAVVSGINNRGGLPWHVVTYRMVADG